ncbi:MAG: nucleotide exchange factor GrpE [Muribaculaceae bacterium]|nr:nucleotide exchange factor GrpE [Muribaculaceae bacterium]
MDKNNDKAHKAEQDVNENDFAPEIADDLEEVADSPETEPNEVETLTMQLEATQEALEKEKKEYLFLMAEFDNYRKRVTKEKAEIIKNGAEKVLSGLLPIVDDFERGLKATKDADNADSVREGMELIYNKLIKYLESNGVKAMDSTGKDFDPELHEAIASIPAPSEDLKGKVIDTTQTGYTINDKVLRHAKVAVGE